MCIRDRYQRRVHGENKEYEITHKMADEKQRRIFSAEQIAVPDDMPSILKNYAKEVIKHNPSDLVQFSRAYFERLMKERENPDPAQFNAIAKP
eukprot:TRINITY_DN11622_c0_g2_i3.p1 TRINITY_DN11622_c0_g2~~TRINITY_DN11622_c0_g2_i3.p1  ORF type:complete len:105 (-),score=25.62 TRINITY_DN11622_c0_g2_i3:126-404(-)